MCVYTHKRTHTHKHICIFCQRDVIIFNVEQESDFPSCVHINNSVVNISVRWLSLHVRFFPKDVGTHWTLCLYLEPWLGKSTICGGFYKFTRLAPPQS